MNFWRILNDVDDYDDDDDDDSVIMAEPLPEFIWIT